MTTNSIPLDKNLADMICKFADNVRTSVVELAKLAAEIRNQHFDVQSNKYDGSFQSFWKNYSMEDRFGKLQNFTKYALAGEAINKVKAQYEQYENRLPITLSALYEISQLTSDELELCLQNRFKRTEITLDRSKWSNPKKPSPLINPTVSASEIKTWRNNWRDPKQPNTDKRRLPLAEIKLHGSFFDFSEGKHDGIVSLEKFNNIIEELVRLKQNMDETIIRFEIHDEKLLSGYKKREEESIKKTAEIASKETKKDRERQLVQIEKALEHCLTSNLKHVPNQYMSIVTGINGLFEETVVDCDNQKRENYISVPNIHEFKQRIAQEFLEAYGARRLLSLVERCSKNGPWSETTMVNKKKDGKYTRVNVSKLQEELRVKKQLQRSKVTSSDENKRRIEELLLLMSPSLSNKTDSELQSISLQWIDGLNAPLKEAAE